MSTDRLEAALAYIRDVQALHGLDAPCDRDIVRLLESGDPGVAVAPPPQDYPLMLPCSCIVAPVKFCMEHAPQEILDKLAALRAVAPPQEPT